MQYNSRGSQSKQYQGVTSRENYNSRLSSSSQIVDQIRKKYDTPTRRQLKQIQTKALAEKPQNYNIDSSLKKSNVVGESQVNTSSSNYSKWGVTLGQSKFVDMSPGFKKQNVNGEEQTIFRKIKEMKDSLLHKNQKIKTTKSIYQPRYSQKYEPRTNDNRVENIDKINSKIQQILSCLKQSQSKSHCMPSIQQQNKRQTRQIIKNPIQNSVKTTYSYSRTSQYNQVSSSYAKPPTSSDLKSVQVKNTSSVYQQQKNKYKLDSPAPKNVQTFDINSNRAGQRESSKVRSFINSVQKQNTIGTNKYEMRSGKKLDDQISKIQSKIQQFEQQKRRLNIQFKPYSHSISKSSSNLSKRSYTVDKQTKPSLARVDTFNPGTQNTKKVEQTYARRIAGYDKIDKQKQKQRQRQKNSEISYAPRFSFEPKKQKGIQGASINVQINKRSDYTRDRAQFSSKTQASQTALFKLKLIPVQNQQKSSTSSRIQCRMLSQDFKRKTDQGILDRRKKLTTQQSSRSRATIKKLVQKLSEQATLDQKFRNNKLYFQSSMQPTKWMELQQELAKKGVKNNKQSLKNIFKVTDQQNNPFFSVRESQTSIPSLATSYVQSQNHWVNELFHKIQKQRLLNEDLTINSFDLQKKGYIVLQDIVRFLNMQTGTFYRNRDLYLIFKRISQQQKISFQQLINTFCK